MLAELPDLNPSTMGGGDLTASLSGPQKAAIIVRLLLSEGAAPALSSLPERLQTELALQLARMAPVDTATVNAVAEEFLAAIENVGLSFPKGLEGALGLLDGVISAGASSFWPTTTTRPPRAFTKKRAGAKPILSVSERPPRAPPFPHSRKTDSPFFLSGQFRHLPSEGSSRH